MKSGAPYSYSLSQFGGLRGPKQLDLRGRPGKSRSQTHCHLVDKCFSPGKAPGTKQSAFSVSVESASGLAPLKEFTEVGVVAEFVPGQIHSHGGNSSHHAVSKPWPCLILTF